jgi:hypothetical protein
LQFPLKDTRHLRPGNSSTEGSSWKREVFSCIVILYLKLDFCWAKAGSSTAESRFSCGFLLSCLVSDSPSFDECVLSPSGLLFRLYLRSPAGMPGLSYSTFLVHRLLPYFATETPRLALPAVRFLVVSKAGRNDRGTTAKKIIAGT